jgi:hypothetical protein
MARKLSGEEKAAYFRKTRYRSALYHLEQCRPLDSYRVLLGAADMAGELLLPLPGEVGSRSIDCCRGRLRKALDAAVAELTRTRADLFPEGP